MAEARIAAPLSAIDAPLCDIPSIPPDRQNQSALDYAKLAACNPAVRELIVDTQIHDNSLTALRIEFLRPHSLLNPLNGFLPRDVVELIALFVSGGRRGARVGDHGSLLTAVGAAAQRAIQEQAAATAAGGRDGCAATTGAAESQHQCEVM